MAPRNFEQRMAQLDAFSPDDDFHRIAFARLAAATSDIAASELRAKVAALRAQVRRYETAMETLGQGVAFFDAEQRLTHCNRQYPALCGLSPESARKGASLRDIAEQCSAGGLWPMSADAYLECSVGAAQSEAAPTSWDAELADGRIVNVRHRQLRDGGWMAIHEDITELEAARAAARERVTLQALIDKVPDKLWVKDAASRFVIANAATASEYALPATVGLIGKTDFDLYPAETAQQFFAIEQTIIQSRQAIVDMDECIVDAAGERRWLSTSKVPLLDDRDQPAGLLGISRDITDRRQADVLRNGQAQILEMIAMSAPLEGVLDRLIRLIESQLSGIMASVLLLDEDGVHLRHGAAPSLAESYAKAVDGAPIGPKAGSCGTAAHRRETVVVCDIATDPLWEDYRELAAAYNYRSCWSTPIFSHKGAVLGTFAMYSATVREPAEPEISLIEVATRIAGIAIERKQAEDRIHFMANHDGLTRLPTRTVFKERLAEAARDAERCDRWATVAFVDLDNFKDVNDSLGHSAGDELLRAVADRMVRCVRPVDTVARLGGDEFVILLVDQPKRLELIAATLDKIRSAIAAPFTIEGRDFQVMISIGVANFPDDGVDADTLIANADAAMYAAKEAGRDNVRFYAAAQSLKIHGGGRVRRA